MKTKQQIFIHLAILSIFAGYGIFTLFQAKNELVALFLGFFGVVFGMAMMLGVKSK